VSNWRCSSGGSVTNRKVRLARAVAEQVLNEQETSPVCDATRAVLMGMQLQAQTINEAQAAVNRAAAAYNSTMQAIGALAAKCEVVDTKLYQLDVDRMVWVERKK
jgi:hypothetical protein